MGHSTKDIQAGKLRHAHWCARNAWNCYTSVAIRRGASELTEELDIEGKVYVCGAIRMAEIAQRKGWLPGSFLNRNFDFAVWRQALGTELLNASFVAGTIARVQIPEGERFFIRPAEDNKAFDGELIDEETLETGGAIPLNVICNTLRSLFHRSEKSTANTGFSL